MAVTYGSILIMHEDPDGTEHTWVYNLPTEKLEKISQEHRDFLEAGIIRNLTIKQAVLVDGN